MQVNIDNIDNVEKVLQKILPYFFSLVFITTMVGALSGYLEHNSWKIGDWLINYQGGFVRRGLLGELIYQVSFFTHIDPGLYVIIFQISFYAIFLNSSYELLKKQYFLLPYIFLIFSPFIFTFQINDLQGGFRKEIIYFAFLAFIVRYANERENDVFEKVFYITLLLYPAAILTHEVLAVFLPYLLVAYLSVITLTKKRVLVISLLVLLSFASFLVSMHYTGTATQVAEISNSIAAINYTIEGGAISWLDKSASFGIASVAEMLNEGQYIYYVLIVAVATLAYIPIYHKIRPVLQNKYSLLLILISMLGSAALCVVAVDWGRFIYINLVSIFLLSLLPVKTENPKEFSRNKTKKVNIFIVLYFMIYVLLWKIPHCCSVGDAYASDYKKINLFTPTKAYADVYFHYFTEKNK